MDDDINKGINLSDDYEEVLAEEPEQESDERKDEDPDE